MKIKERLKTCFLRLFDSFLRGAIKLRVEGESWAVVKRIVSGILGTVHPFV